MRKIEVQNGGIVSDGCEENTGSLEIRNWESGMTAWNPFIYT